MVTKDLADDSTLRSVAEPLLIIGASTRAAAESARRAGFAPQVADLFADLDLKELCPATRVENYPQDFEGFLRHAPPAEWIYTGALENYPGLIERCSAIRPLLGNAAAVLRRVRDPILVATCLERAGLPVLPVRHHADGLPRDGSWLRKPLRSAGGKHVDLWTGAESPDADNAVYYQPFQRGMACGAVFVAGQGSVQLLGVTQQLLVHGSFAYAGSIGPLPLGRMRQDLLTSMGQALAGAFQLIGLFGVDFILNGEDIWPVEVNPRYTASVEVMERATGLHALALHVRACRGQPLPSVQTAPQCYAAKQILFAAESFTVSNDLRTILPNLADVPSPGTLIPRGAPIATLLCHAPSLKEVHPILATNYQQAQHHLPLVPTTTATGDRN